MCMMCPVRTECAEYQEGTRSEYGMWAGKIVQRGAKQ